MRIKRLSAGSTLLLLFVSLTIVIFTYISIKLLPSFAIGGPESGNDAEYYHALGMGYVSSSVNLWGDMLAWLGRHGLYNRQSTSFLLFLSYLALAFLSPRVAFLGTSRQYARISSVSIWRWTASLVILTYPSLFLFTLDIYRDVAMASLCVVVHILAYNVKNASYPLLRVFQIILFCAACFALFKFRPYLGFSCFASLFFNQRLVGKRIYIALFLGLCILALLYSTGLIDPIVIYRGEEGFATGGSSFGISLMAQNPLSFTFYFMISYIYQIFGLYFTSFQSLALFAIETLPFMAALVYAIRNRQLMDKFALYLFYFFIIYTCFIAIGNDNLGTAIRLRIHAYISVYIMALRLFVLGKTSSLNPSSFVA